MEKINWENVFNSNHKRHGWFATAFDIAKNAGYPYILWNDKVISTEDGTDTGWVLDNGVFVNMNTDEDEILFV